MGAARAPFSGSSERQSSDERACTREREGERERERERVEREKESRERENEAPRRLASYVVLMVCG